MVNKQTKVLFTGATGFIGGAVLTAILQRPDLADRLDITALYRSAEHAKLLQQLGVTPVQGDLSDGEKTALLASESDLIIDIAHSDTSVAAILEGARGRAASGLPPLTYIHTGGTGVLSDDSLGLYEGSDFYDDTSVKDMKRIPETAWHRDVDLSIYNADEEGYLRAYLILPALVYGTGRGPVRTESEQLPKLVDLALGRGQAGQVGLGKSIRGSVHITDLCDLYLLLLSRVLDGPSLPSGWEGTFIGASGMQSWGTLSEAVGKRLHERGLIPSAAVTSFTHEELSAIGPLAGKLLGSNSCPLAKRAKRDLGWQPSQRPIGEVAQSDIDYHLQLRGL
ncbi:hypothetical protein JCM10207_003289 [Rhodosporidiobolus poonsookiae]